MGITKFVLYGQRLAQRQFMDRRNTFPALFAFILHFDIDKFKDADAQLGEAVFD